VSEAAGAKRYVVMTRWRGPRALTTAEAAASIRAPLPRSNLGSPSLKKARPVAASLPLGFETGSIAILSQMSFQGFSGAQIVPSVVQPAGQLAANVGKQTVSTFSAQHLPPSICCVPGRQTAWGW